MSACSYMVRPEACFSPPQMCAHTRGYRKTHANSGASVTSPRACISVCFSRCLSALSHYGEAKEHRFLHLYRFFRGGGRCWWHFCEVFFLFHLNSNKAKILTSRRLPAPFSPPSHRFKRCSLARVNHTIPSSTSVSELIVTHMETCCCFLD